MSGFSAETSLSAADANAGAEFFFETLRNTFGKASAQAGLSERWFTIGGEAVKLRFAGPALQPLITPALEHLAADPADAPALTVCFWDSASTDTRMPAPPWPATAYGQRGEILGYNTERFRTVYQHGVNALHMFDAHRCIALYWVARPSQIPYWERSFPVRTILHWWTQGQALQLMHAGAVGGASGGVLIAGKSGSGKSTTTLACLDGGMSYAGDDYVLTRVEPEPQVHSVYGTAKLEPDNLRRFPHLRRFVSNPDSLENEKAMIFLKDACPAQLARGFPVRALLLPHVTGRRDTTLRRATRIACLEALAPTTILHLPGAGYDAFHKMSLLSRSIPGYILEAGTELEQIPRVIRGLLEGGLS
jgi:hypothetical protein